MGKFTLENIARAGKRAIGKTFLATTILASAMLPGCIGGGGDKSYVDPDPFPVDSPPVWFGIYNGEATEDSAYFSDGAYAYDPDGGVIMYSKIQGPAFLNAGTITGELSGAPKYSDIGDNQEVIIQASDGTLTTDLVFPMNVKPKI